MAKTKTSNEQKKSGKSLFVTHRSSHNKSLADKKLVKEILVDALTHNDIETFQDVLVSYLRTTSKLNLSKRTKIGRTTLYDLIDPEKPFNPTLETIGKIFEELAA
jgi:DNA-binding phage protein